MTDSKHLSEICRQFETESTPSPYGNGHINETYVTDSPRYILQKINTSIFTHPDEVMENIVAVTAHVRKKLVETGGDPERQTLTVIPTRKGESFFRDVDGSCYRMYRFIEGSVTHESADKPEILFEAGRAFGIFQRMLDDFPAEKLHETIVKFHYTPNRVKQLQEAISKDAAGRLASVRDEVAFALSYADRAGVIVGAIERGEVPVRVTHNDTKLNNILFDAETDSGLCVIDLDTVMPGSLLYDFGDALRFGASSGAEDETDLSKIYFDLDKFAAFTKGFLSETGSCLTKTERELLPFSALLLTYECGIRFLADYLNGDTYFKIHRPNHNLDRARTQFKLVADISEKLDRMAKIVDDCL